MSSRRAALNFARWVNDVKRPRRSTAKSDVSVGVQASSSKAAARASKSHDSADHEYNPNRYREVTPNLAAEY